MSKPRAPYKSASPAGPDAAGDPLLRAQRAALGLAGMRTAVAGSRTRGALVGAVTFVLLVLTACTGSTSSPTQPPNNLPAADDVVKQLAAGLSKGVLSGVALTTPTATTQADLTTIMAGMDGLLPTVTPGTITYNGADSTATATLHQQYLLGSQKFDFDSSADLSHNDVGWQVEWAPTIVSPALSEQTRLRHTRTMPKRASIVGWNKLALVEEREVWQVGLDKHLIPANQAASSAAKLAKALKINSANYVKKVAAAGTDAWVVAITVRQKDLPANLDNIPGARYIPTTAMLAPTSTFAQAILGSMGSPTAKQIADSHGDIEGDDQVGISGLEARYDAQLRGTVGHTIDIVARSSASASASPSASAASTPSATESAGAASSGASASAGPGTVLFTSKPAAGKPLQITLDLDQQYKAEQVLAKASGVASMVVLDRSTGAVRVAANSAAANGQPVATYGRVEPGSTFKVVSSLALIRKGYTAKSVVNCPATTTVNGKSFKNYSDFPASKIGRITLADAVANSCNTAFIGLAGKLGANDLAQAAGSLGVGVDYDSGFPSFYGSVPASSDPATHAADLIGQGQVLASPMAMAGVAASVAAGHTVVPNLVVGNAPKSKAAALTAAEAAQLQTLMKGVVTSGSGRGLAGLMTGAKTGTAEYGTAKPPKTHAWMIAWNSKIAIAVMVFDGESGSKTAAPLIKAFLQP